MNFPAVHLIPLAVCLLIAAIWDVSARRIPNAVCGAIAVAGLGAQFWDAGALRAVGGLGAAAITVALLYVFWRRGGIGGGDVKLAGAVATWVGPWSLPTYWLATALAGGGIAAICLLASQKAARQEIRLNLTLAAYHQMIPTVGPARTERMSVPYGVAIAAGAVFVWWHGA
ncbi:MAG: A24 family peptidase [Pseudomonadota bacterium]